jgi:hypothetical protein
MISPRAIPGEAGNRIRQHQTALAIGIDNFRFTAIGVADDIAGTQGVAARHIFRHRQHGGDIGIKPELDDGKNSAGYRRGGSHVGLHPGNLLDVALEIDAAGIEGDTLAGKAQASLSSIRIKANDARLVCTAATDGLRRAETMLRKFGFAPDFDGYIQLARTLCNHLRKTFRHKVATRGLDQIPHPVDRPAGSHADLERSFQARSIRDQQLNRRFRLVRTEMSADQAGLGGSAHDQSRVDAKPVQGDDGRTSFAQEMRGGHKGIAQRVCGKRVARSDAHQNYRRLIRRRHQKCRKLPDLALERWIQAQHMTGKLPAMCRLPRQLGIGNFKTLGSRKSRHHQNVRFGQDRRLAADT